MLHHTHFMDPTRKRGAVAVTVCVCLVIFVGFGAIVLDVGVMYNVRADLQRTADAAALAGATSLASDTMLQIRINGADSALTSAMDTMTSSRSGTVATLNPSFGTSATSLASGDMKLGQIDLTSATSQIQTGVAATSYNAVTVIARRQAGGSNGDIDLFFGSFYGLSTSEAVTIATAAFDDRVAGFDPGLEPGILAPFTISEAVYNGQLSAGADGYGYDEVSDTVSSSGDGLPEISLYPDSYGPGNFGLLNIGTPNQGTPALRVHIEDGVPGADVAAEIGTSDIIFYDSAGNPLTYQITGNPGLTATLESSIATRIGDVIGFLIHDVVAGTGSNLTYTVKDIRYGRVMDVNLNGAPSSKNFWVQPVSFTGGGVVIDPNAPSTNGMAGRVVLVR